MDVHISNWRHCGSKCSFLVHVIFPEEFLYENNIPKTPNLIIHAQTRYNNSLRCTPNLRVWCKFFDTNSCNFGGESLSLATSIPIVLDCGEMYNPLDIVTLKIQDPATKEKIFIDFFYMSLVTTFKKEKEVVKIGNEKKQQEASKNEETTQLEEIFRSIVPESSRNDKRSCSPLSVLSGLLHTEINSVQRHHHALENPGAVRGTDAPQKKLSKDISQKNEKEPILLKYKLLKKYNITYTPKTHIISKSTFVVCTYIDFPCCNVSSCNSVLDLMTLQEMQNINPLGALILNNTFLETKQLECVHSIEHACSDDEMQIYQKLPICIENKKYTRDILNDHFEEACFVLRQTVSESCSWVKACLALTNKKTGIWVDVLDLWERGKPTLGKQINHTSYNYDHNTFWITLLDCPEVQTVIKREGCACLVVDTSLSAWLIIPGGFAIKGQYFISEEDLKIIKWRYG
ncbi:DNA packaging tegument protein UL17 [Vespertilionid gammaherpesvirus 1]|uniref:DNA packaging tegument protein UL17 n=1 Tax=Vespertilionid gammaherpesvirus 1 TaxID=2560830 RepID=A0A109QFK6_9GAMA|nr:DNA packaging tegument protein UL17 [Myotis gammaherpesvirus 8]AMA67387.1 DNA packaging tegument protein UL17 [Vespertilionid gammaherpesvirus 1]